MFKSLLITVLAVSRAIALDVTATFSPSASVVKDSNVSLQCSWRAGVTETDFTLTISFNSGSGRKIFYANSLTGVVPSPDRHSRISEDTSARNLTSYTMIIQNTQCMDEGNYNCKIIYRRTDTGRDGIKDNAQVLYIKVPPRSPAFTTVPQNGVPEGSFINVKCNANVGRPGKGSIQWRYYSNGAETTTIVNAQVTDTQSTLMSGDDPCTERWESRISLMADRTFQNLSLACYVVNTDFPVTQPGCTSDNFCIQTGPISILYGVSDITVNSAPQSMSYEGGTTTLTCYADGNPKPSYTWTKEDDVSRTLTGIQDGDVSKIVLANLRLDLDDGTYNCTASNVVVGTLYTISREVNVNVVATTTTYRTTKTSTASGFSTNVTKAVIADTSQTMATTTASGNSTNVTAYVIADTSPSSDEEIGIIIGTIAALFVIVLVLFIVWYCIKKER